MDIVFGFFSIVVGLLITYVLGLQFYKLGVSLKHRFPIIYRLYKIFWSLVVALVLILGLDLIKSNIDNKKRENRKEKLISIINPTIDFQKDTMDRIRRAKRERISDKDIFDAMMSTPKYRERLQQAIESGYSYQEVALSLGLYVQQDYTPPML